MIEIEQLENKLIVITQNMEHLESASVGLWVKAGSRDEKENEHGIAHLLEHMAFKGTNTRNAQDIVTEIENVGGDINAATGVETTAYYARVLKKDVKLAINIFADILTDSVFDETELEREKHVIVQEIGASQDDPAELIYDYFHETAFQNQAIGRPILGSVKSIEGFSADNLRDYLNSHYQGHNMVLAAVGNVNHREIVELAKEKFGNIEDNKTQEPVKAEYVGGEKRINRKLQEAQIAIGFPGRAYHVKDFYASQIFAMILGGGMSSRLYQEVREKKGLCYSIYATHTGYCDTGLFSIHAATEKDDVKTLMPIIINELKKTMENIEKQEVDRAREQIRAGLLMVQETPSARAGQIARQMLLFGRHITNDELMERLNAINEKRIQGLAQKMFLDENITIAAVGPIKNMMEQGEIVTKLNA